MNDDAVTCLACSRLSFPYRHPYLHPSAQILDWFEEPEPFYFALPLHRVSFQGIDEEALILITLLQKGPAHQSRLRLGHMDPSSPIEKHEVLPPILYAGCLFLLLSVASY